MQFTLASAATALLAATTSVSAAAVSTRDLNDITCTGEVIVGTLKVRNPDNSLHTAAFLNAYTDGQGRPKLVTKLNGTPVPQDRKFAFKVCNSAEYIIPGKRAEQSKSGFLSPNNHREKALKVGNVAAQAGNGHQRQWDLVSDVEKSDKFTYDTLNEWFNLHNNGTFYTLAYGGREGGNTAGFGYSPRSVHSADGQTIDVRMEYWNEYNLDLGYRVYGYSLELHP